MVEYVKSLIDEHDVRAGAFYRVWERDLTDSLVYIIDDVGAEYPLYHHEYEEVESKPQFTEHSNPFIREEAVIKKMIVSEHHRLSNGLDLAINIRDDYGVTIDLENGQYSKSEVTELARILKEISEVME